MKIQTPEIDFKVLVYPYIYLPLYFIKQMIIWVLKLIFSITKAIYNLMLFLFLTYCVARVSDDNGTSTENFWTQTIALINCRNYISKGYAITIHL